jgi:hypothetical protein
VRNQRIGVAGLDVCRPTGGERDTRAAFISY